MLLFFVVVVRIGHSSVQLGVLGNQESKRENMARRTMLFVIVLCSLSTYLASYPSFQVASSASLGLHAVAARLGYFACRNPRCDTSSLCTYISHLCGVDMPVQTVSHAPRRYGLRGVKRPSEVFHCRPAYHEAADGSQFLIFRLHQPSPVSDALAK